MMIDLQFRLRRKVKSVLLCSIAVLVLVAQFAQACWMAVSLEDFIKGEHVIVVGEIQRVQFAPKSYRAEDMAFIKIEKILKRRLPSPELKIGGELPLSMPSASNEMVLSVDLYYQKGQRGIWMLYYQGGKYFAGHPMSFQSLSEEEKIAAIVHQQAKQRATGTKLSAKK